MAPKGYQNAPVITSTAHDMSWHPKAIRMLL